MQQPSAPTTGDKIELKDVTGALLYFTVKELKRDVETVHGLSDMILCDVAVLDGDKKGTTYTDTGIFPKLLVGQLKGVVGSVDPVIVGRLGQGLANPGKSAPWILNTPTADDLAAAVKYERYAAEQFAKEQEPF